MKSIDEVLARLSAANAGLSDPKQPLTGWALDPIYFDNRRMTRADLDRVSSTRPIGIMHASGHIMNVNTRALELAGMLRTGVNHPGVPLGDDGLPTGEMKGPDAMTPLGPHVGLDRGLLASDEPGLRAFARLCVRKGVTTAADLANLLAAARGRDDAARDRRGWLSRPYRVAARRARHQPGRAGRPGCRTAQA